MTITEVAIMNIGVMLNSAAIMIVCWRMIKNLDAVHLRVGAFERLVEKDFVELRTRVFQLERNHDDLRIRFTGK